PRAKHKPNTLGYAKETESRWPMCIWPTLENSANLRRNSRVGQFRYLVNSGHPGERIWRIGSDKTHSPCNPIGMDLTPSCLLALLRVLSEMPCEAASFSTTLDRAVFCESFALRN